MLDRCEGRTDTFHRGLIARLISGKLNISRPITDFGRKKCPWCVRIDKVGRNRQPGTKNRTLREFRLSTSATFTARITKKASAALMFDLILSDT